MKLFYYNFVNLWNYDKNIKMEVFKFKDGYLIFPTDGAYDIPERYKNDIVELILYDKRITELLNLPSELKILKLHDNQIAEIKNLPPGIKRLALCNNQITLISDNLPKNLRIFGSTDKQICKLRFNSFKANIWKIHRNNDISEVEILYDPYLGLGLYKSLWKRIL